MFHEQHFEINSPTHPISIEFAAPALGDSQRRPGPGIDRLSLWILKAAVAEMAAVGLTCYGASAIYHAIAFPEWPTALRYGIAALLIALAHGGMALAFLDFKRLRQQRYQSFLLAGLRSVAFAMAFFLSALFLLKLAEDYSRATFVIQVIGVSAAVLATRSLSFVRMRRAIGSGWLAGRRAIVIGDVRHRTAFGDRLQGFGIGIVEWLPITAFARGPRRRLRQTLAACRALHADDVVILAGPGELPEVAALVDDLSQLPVAVHLIPVGVGEFLAGSAMSGLGDIRTLQLIRPPLSMIDILAKRLFDVAAALIGLVLLSPLLLATALAIKCDSRGPVLFRQERNGYNNRGITVLKFRSMSVTAGDAPFSPAARFDARVTRVGRFIRRTSIDELPQLLNVLRGDMSLVGPRPHATAHNAMFEQRISPFSRRHNVKPGITGWAQVNQCRGEADTLEKMQRRLDYDLFYIDHWSFYFDMKIIVLTLLALISRDELVNVY
jgi:Undecaprenyl-phosphate glucose phosphotransferase